MRRQRSRHQINCSSSCFGRITASILMGSILHSPISAFAQVNNAVTRPAIINQATYTYTDSATQYQFQGSSSQLNVSTTPLIDPLGRILGCGGQLLSDYQGFSVALYEPNPNDPTGTELGQLVTLTRTEVPDIPDNGVPQGINPNADNNNPFFLTNTNQGYYNFLFDPNKGQTTPGKSYILVVNPPANSIYIQRRIKLAIVESTNGSQNDVLQYTATSVDGQPISIEGATQLSNEVFIADAEKIGLNLLPLQLDLGLCQSEQVEIIKTGDRATAEPGDTVIYRLSLRNQGDAGLDNVVVNDSLPVGFKFLPQSVQAAIDGQAVSVTTENKDSQVIFRTPVIIPSGKVLNIVYAVQLTPDAVRGSGRNTAIINAQRIDNKFAVKDGPVSHKLQIRPGIVSNCGTLIGRVFVDKNFDGEQQAGEKGIPNAVIFLEDGNRITTDTNGLFSVANVLPGSHTGVIDLNSVPGYTLAPNRKFKERNSQSRLVRLEPGGMVRMNFALTPTSAEEVKK